MAEQLVLVTGASGHVGSRLVPQLVRSGCRVRALSRAEREPLPGVEPAAGDVRDPQSIAAALDGVKAAYYLIHGLAESGDLEEVEREAARTFAREALAAGVGRVVYSGGLAHGDDLSPHLRSRHEVGEILRAEGPATVELRASIVIGAGSLSFELVRALVDSLPALILPDWVDTPCQPIAVEDVVAYLVASLDVDVDGSVVYEIGGADAITYAELLELYGDAVGKAPPRLSLPFPAMPLPALLQRIAPGRARVWLKLVEGLRFDSTVRNPTADDAFEVDPAGAREAISRALAETEPS